MSAEPIHFPPFHFDPRAQRLYRGQAAVPLRPKTYAVLRHLLGRAGQLVTKEDLFDAVWPETAVSDGVLKVSIRELREALGDDPRSPRYIETAHRAGYRFIAEVAGSNVPVYLSSFVGRERATADLQALLPLVRLVTLTGAGGSGKTRLAARVADEARGAFPDGVWWVDLAPLADAGLVAQAASSVLGLHDQPGRTRTETLAQYLRTKELLLVLDNCEHLVESCAALATALLRACPRLKILATSREGLGVAGETFWPVPSLTLPDVFSPGRLEELVSCEAVRLFLDRARAAQPAFEPDAQGAEALVRVCRRLDGLPLAIELAAARLKVLSVDELAARLDDGFQLLTASGRTALPRHQTLRATMDWSYALLPEPERALLLRLSVFAGGWTLEAAEHAGAGMGLAAVEVLDLLSRLVDKSLVQVRDQAGATRYGLLETVRQYAREKLEEAGDSLAARCRHSEYYLGLAETLAPCINTRARRATLLRLESEHGNLREALRFFAETNHVDTELRLTHALRFYWFHRGYWSESRAWLRDALDRSAAQGRTSARGRALCSDAIFACFMGDRAMALDELEESASIHRDQGDRLDLADALSMFTFAVDIDDMARAQVLAAESIAIYRDEGGTKFDLALATCQLATALYVGEDYDAALTAYQEAIGIFRELGDLWALSAPLTKLGLVFFRRGELDVALANLKESVSLQRDTRERWFLSLSLEGLARVLAAQGDHERAARLLGAGESLREAIGAAIFPFYLRDQDQALAALRAAIGSETMAALWSEGRAMTIEQAIAYALAEDRSDRDEGHEPAD